jgi:hypothetical protein
MKTRAILLALPVLLAISSCTRDNRTSVDVQSICFPTKDCTFGATCDTNVIGGFSMDVALTPVAEMFLQVANRLADNANAQQGKTNTNDAHIDGVTVEYSGLALPSLSYDASNQLVPTAGHAVVAINPIWARTLAEYNALLTAVPAGTSKSVVAKIRLRGYLTDGSRWETGDFRTAIELCNGCLSPAPCPAGELTCPFAGVDPVTCGTTSG